MICPILSQQLEEERVLEDCQKEECQWWTQGNCIIHDLNKNLKSLNSEIFKGFSRLIDHSYHRKYRL